ncbi:MAG TPA: DUF5915 domain-containing protein, partial [Ktedonobacterales bacterium]|nr:DUF5915 domain-containing protein [Ktedonobacterales bacterium]
RSRRRFWKSEEDSDKRAAYLTLYECLVTVTKLLAPLTPFLAESLYQNLVRSVDGSAPESVHLCDWPVANDALFSPRLHDETALVMRMVNLGRAAREKAQIRVRQPLGVLYARVGNDGDAEALQRLAGQVLEELNVKRLELLPAESDMLVYALRPQMKVLGPKHGKLAQKVLAALRAVDPQAGAAALRDEGKLELNVEGQTVALLPEEVEIEASAREGYVAAEERGAVAVIETTLTPDLLAEGLVRDFSHLVQEVRKHAGLAIEDTIETWLMTDADLAAIAVEFRGYIEEETLSKRLVVQSEGPSLAPSGDSVYTEEIPASKLNGHPATVTVRKTH